MKKYSYFLICIFCPVLFARKSQPPHIITILIDDLGWNDVGFHGSQQIKTYNMDALAYSGIILNRHYVLPSCTPSRSALLTGLYPIRTGLQGFPLKAGENRNLPVSFKLKPEYLRELGYRTHMVGKWHLGYETYENVPNQRGFDSFFGYYNGYVDYYKFGYNQSVFGDKIEYYYGYDLHYNDNVYWTDKETYATRLFTQQAENIIEKHNESEPLYLYLSHLATHTGDDDIGMEVPRDANVNKTYEHIKDYNRRAFAGCLEELDKSVGKVVAALHKKNMLSNSIILVISDNGAHTVSIDMPPNWSSNWPLAGTKFTMYEGGVRGAGFLWSPLLPKGILHEEFLHISDWLPTFYAAAGGDLNKLGTMDGISHWEALKKRSSVKRDNILLNVDDKTGAEGILINDRWKLVKGGFPNYGYYDYHWGKEENTKPNPKYNLNDVFESQAGKIIQSLKQYKNILNEEKASVLRKKSTVRCQPPEQKTADENGFVKANNDFRCKDFCIFDIINDPCELEPIQNEEILQLGIRKLMEHKRKMIRQVDSFVEPDSNPANFGGVWMPWDYKKCTTSVARDFTSQHVNLAVLLTLSWYSLIPL